MHVHRLAAVLLCAPFSFAQAATPAPAHKVQKVVIINLAWDSVRAAEVEAETKHDLVKKGVFADSVRTLTQGDKKPATVQELAELIKANGYDSVLCVGARKTMQITPADKQNDFATLESCLSIFLTGKYPSGESLRTEPFVVEAQPTINPPTNSNMATPHTPIATNPGATPVIYYKRTLRLFDVPKQTLFWEKKIMLKMPRDLQGSLQASWIAHETIKTLDQAGLLP